jgi:hypothetical protein
VKRWSLALAIAGVLALAVWGWASPYWTVRSLKRAADVGDVATLSAHIDYPAVRASIKAQLRSRLAHAGGGSPLEALGMTAARSLSDPIVDAAVTPQGMQVIFASASAAQQRRPTALGLRANTMRFRREAIGRFVLENGEGSGALVFQLRGVRWMLTDLPLPPEITP